MLSYLFTGHASRYYPEIVIPGEGTLVAIPGDIRQFEDPPNDGNWVPCEKPAAKQRKAKES